MGDAAGAIPALRRALAQGAEAKALAREMLRRALALADADDCYGALKLARRVMLHEQEVLGLAPPASARVPCPVEEPA